MGANTHIEWCDHTFNPWMGCTKVSPACLHCYAEALSKRTGRGEYKRGVPRVRTSAANWKLPLKWNRDFEGCWTSPERPEREFNAFGWRSHRPRVFSASLADWLDEEVPIEWLADFLRLVHDTPHLDWLLLTKRPENWKPRLLAVMRRFDNDSAFTLETLPPEYHLALNWVCGDAPANVWIGATVEDHERRSRVPELMKIPAKVRFLSVEPMLSRVDLCEFLNIWWNQTEEKYVQDAPSPIHWVICGGESGHGARPMVPDFARSLRDQCQAAGVAFHFKQWGEWLPGEEHYQGPEWKFQDGSLMDSHLFPDLNDNPPGWEYEPLFTTIFRKVGKKVAGRLLDGVEHNGFPTTKG
jgi:protein gp37